MLSALKHRVAVSKCGRRYLVHRRVSRASNENARLLSGLSESRWVVRVAAPTGPDGDRYGDVPFAADLAQALEPSVGSVNVLRRDQIVRDADVVLTLRGLAPMPRVAGAVNILWVISHPELVSHEELREYDLIYAAGPVWAREQAARSRVDVRPLLQATNPHRFKPMPDIVKREGVVFVGTTRAVERPAVLWAVASGVTVEIHGHGWDEFIPAHLVTSEHLRNEDLPLTYARADIVLNDHWSDMAQSGFISNRVFDALATGAVVVTDHVQGIESLSPTLVRVFDSPESLARLARAGGPGDEKLRNAEAIRVGTEHSFSARAEQIIADVSELLRQVSRFERLKHLRRVRQRRVQAMTAWRMTAAR